MSKKLVANDLDFIFHNKENDQIEFKYGTLVPDVIAKCIACWPTQKAGK